MMMARAETVSAGRPAARVAIGACLWAAAMAASAAASLTWQRDWALDGQARLLIGFFAGGGLLAYPTALMLLNRFLPHSWQPTRRFAAAFILLGAATVGLTALLFALQFRTYYAQWHDEPGTKRFLFETVFTILSACYQFLVLGLRIYIPFGLAALVAASIAFAQRRI